MIANPQRTHGSTRSMTCDTGTRVKATPSSRTSRMTVSPTNNIRNSTWEDSTSGYMNSDSRSAVLFSVAASHSQKARSDTLGAAQLLRELLVAIRADVVDVAADGEQRILVLRLDDLERAIGGVDHRPRFRDPLRRTTRTRRDQQQVAGFSELNRAGPDAVPLVLGGRKFLVCAGFVDHGADRLPQRVGGRIDHVQHQIFHVDGGLEWRHLRRGRWSGARGQAHEWQEPRDYPHRAPSYYIGRVGCLKLPAKAGS